MSTTAPYILRLRLECRHAIETRVYYDPADVSKYHKWEGRLMYCPDCRKIRKVIKLAKGIL